MESGIATRGTSESVCYRKMIGRIVVVAPGRTKAGGNLVRLALRGCRSWMCSQPFEYRLNLLSITSLWATSAARSDDMALMSRHHVSPQCERLDEQSRRRERDAPRAGEASDRSRTRLMAVEGHCLLSQSGAPDQFSPSLRAPAGDRSPTMTVVCSSSG